jgi:hypothetical protein
VFAELDENLYNKILIPAWPGLGIVQRKVPDVGPQEDDQP